MTNDDHGITYAQIRRFKRIATSMRRLLEELQETCPGANLYLEDQGNWNLMTGPSHDEKERRRFDRVVESARVPYSGGGAW